MRHKPFEESKYTMYLRYIPISMYPVVKLFREQGISDEMLYQGRLKRLIAVAVKKRQRDEMLYQGRLKRFRKNT